MKIGDITELVNNYVYSNFGHGAEDINVKKNPSFRIDMVNRTDAGYNLQVRENYGLEN